MDASNTLLVSCCLFCSPKFKKIIITIDITKCNQFTTLNLLLALISYFHLRKLIYFSILSPLSSILVIWP